MKKFLGILVIAATMVACNNSGEGSTNPDSLNNAGVDTTPIINTPIDTNTVAPVDTNTVRPGDTTATRK